MAWYEIFALFFFVGSVVFLLILALVWDIRRIKECVISLRKEQQFYELLLNGFTIKITTDKFLRR